MDITIWKIFVSLGIPGLALGVLYALYSKFNWKFSKVPSSWMGPIVVLFLVLTSGIIFYTLARYAPSNNEPSDSSLSSADNKKYRRIYYENFRKEPEDDDLSPIWLKGESGDWEGQFKFGDHGAYVLCNKSNDRSASYTSRLSYITPEGGVADLKNSKVILNVKIGEPITKYSGAGILFRKSADAPDYYAFVLNAGNIVSLMRRSEDTMSILWSEEFSSASKDGSAKLKIIGHDSDLYLYVNDEHIHTERKCDLLVGEPGVFAYSTGCFMFNSYAVFQEVNNFGN